MKILWNLLDISTSHEYNNILPKLGNASWYHGCCAIPPANIYRVKMYIVRVEESRRGRASKEKKLNIRRVGTHTHTHKESDKWYFTILYYCTYKRAC